MLISIIFMAACFYVIYLKGKKWKHISSFYDRDGKGTILGKAVFSVFLALTLFLPMFVLPDLEWTAAVLTVCTAIIGFEVARGYVKSKQKTNKSLLLGNVIIITAYITTHLSLTSFILLQIVATSVAIDLFANVIGKNLAQNEKLKGFRLQYPEWISPNKSLTAAMLAIILVTFLNGFLPEGWSLSSFTCVAAGIGAVIGDGVFSVFKRRLGIKDFFPTLGPIGGISDRADSWVFALLFATAWL